MSHNYGRALCVNHRDNRLVELNSTLRCEQRTGIKLKTIPTCHIQHNFFLLEELEPFMSSEKEKAEKGN